MSDSDAKVPGESGEVAPICNVVQFRCASPTMGRPFATREARLRSLRSAVLDGRYSIVWHDEQGKLHDLSANETLEWIDRALSGK